MKKIAILLLVCIAHSITSFSQITELILNDPDRVAPTNIRATPGGAIIRTIDSREESLVVNIVSKDGNYFLVKSYQYCGRDEIKLSKKGYIHYSVLGVYISNYGGDNIPVFSSASTTGSFKRVKYTDEFVNVLDFKNGLFQVYRKKSNEKFWIESRYLCFSACTSCS